MVLDLQHFVDYVVVPCASTALQGCDHRPTDLLYVERPSGSLPSLRDARLEDHRAPTQNSVTIQSVRTIGRRLASNKTPQRLLRVGRTVALMT